MNLLQELFKNKKLCKKLGIFLKNYGVLGLEEALQSYTNMQDTYICKNKTSISKIPIGEIFYLEIQQHLITVHTCCDTYQKYGTLNNELKVLAYYGFIKCNQSCIVSLSKIKTIYNNKIILINNTEIHMSRNYASKVLTYFSCTDIF